MTFSILIVSQVDYATQSLQNCLQRADYQIKVVSTVEAALEIASQTHPDLLLIEHELPEIDGIKITQVMRDSRHLTSTAIMIISRNPSTQEIESSLNSGADSHMSAPVSKNLLLAQIQALLRRTQPPHE